jgi:gluconokinase
MTGDAPVVVIMGVAGCGKSTIAEFLAARWGFDALEGDVLHPSANAAKMAAGIPLDDADRAPWLGAIAKHARNRRGGLVISCSALARRYRDTLRMGAPLALFIHLDGPPELMEARVAARTGHFMPSSLVASQFAVLERLEHDERGLTIDAGLDPCTVAELVERHLAS